jgi:hypothetical protein
MCRGASGTTGSGSVQRLPFKALSAPIGGRPPDVVEQTSGRQGLAQLRYTASNIDRCHRQTRAVDGIDQLLRGRLLFDAQGIEGRDRGVTKVGRDGFLTAVTGVVAIDGVQTGCHPNHRERPPQPGEAQNSGSLIERIRSSSAAASSNVASPGPATEMARWVDRDWIRDHMRELVGGPGPTSPTTCTDRASRVG